MHLYKIFILAGLIVLTGCTENINRETKSYEGETIMVGPVNWDGLTQGQYGEWFTPTYMNYHVDVESLDRVAPVIQDVEIIVFLGTWCSDSHVQIPQFYKMMDYLGYDINRMKVYGLERLEDYTLVSPTGEEQAYDITHVPTFIFLLDGVELGRITEYPRTTIEKDMVGILLGE